MKNIRLYLISSAVVLLALGVGSWLVGFWEKPLPPPAPLRLPSAAPAPLDLSTLPPATPAPAAVTAANAPAPEAGTETQPESLSEASERAAAEAAAQAAQVEAQRRAKIMANNLRQLASAGQQYMLDKGVTEASYQDVVGTSTDSYIRSITPAADENYENIVIYQNTTSISIGSSDGVTAVYNL